MQPGIIITIKLENSFWKLSAQKSDTQNKLKYEKNSTPNVQWVYFWEFSSPKVQAARTNPYSA